MPGRRRPALQYSDDATRKRKRQHSASTDDESSRRGKRRRSSPNTSESRRHKKLGEESSGRKRMTGTKEFIEKMKSLKTSTRKIEASQLKPEKVDFHIEENRAGHHTDEYAMESLIIRRGQEFKVTLAFDRPFDLRKDQLTLQLTFGTRPQKSKNSLIRVKEAKELSTSSWGMRVDGTVPGNNVNLTLMSPANAFVGEYSVYVETKTKKTGSEECLRFRKKLNETFFVLFNAWCKGTVLV
ncbi:coagulation factor XIII A chain [Exaiptasia diaphana]|uniref:Transglutaminase N-terminal domain-containing protein n=1 Tax=Exaiptasia diaphana TaxID=2652724 RepID=A0A913Y8X0_EXADI|nr:coagulation factor XIII A chain [Exaiptasia diaphana]